MHGAGGRTGLRPAAAIRTGRVCLLGKNKPQTACEVNGVPYIVLSPEDEVL